MTTRQIGRKIAAKNASMAQKVGGVMDWKEQLTTVVEEAGIQQLDARFVCMKHQGKWFLKRFFIANSASENLKDTSKDSTREALIKKLGDL